MASVSLAACCCRDNSAGEATSVVSGCGGATMVLWRARCYTLDRQSEREKVRAGEWSEWRVRWLDQPGQPRRAIAMRWPWWTVEVGGSTSAISG